MVDVTAPMINETVDIPAKRTVFISLVTRSYTIIVKIYARHTLYSFPRPPIKLRTPVRNSIGKVTEYDNPPLNIVEMNSS